MDKENVLKEIKTVQLRLINKTVSQHEIIQLTLVLLALYQKYVALTEEDKDIKKAA